MITSEDEAKIRLAHNGKKVHRNWNRIGKHDGRFPLPRCAVELAMFVDPTPATADRIVLYDAF